MTKLPKFAAIVLILCAGQNQADDSQFCAGFEAGYISGYKKAAQTSFDPIPPYCPVAAAWSISAPESSWDHGYQVGYEQGLNDGRPGW